ncbi:MAG: STAS domain-containing protein [Ardenticatenaceae bacterium]|nr:STAS domain-containing protein [Anaerolineales bacterium]MCB9006497.1 STAS domain-containing protein [Ardenticatenaceae bacterium]
MELRTRYFNDVAILSVNGRLDAVTAPQLTQLATEQMDAGYGRLVIDLKNVKFLSSAGIKALVKMTQHSRQQGGDLRIANVRGQIKQVIYLAGLNTVIKVYPNVVGATASYFPGPMPGP